MSDPGPAGAPGPAPDGAPTIVQAGLRGLCPRCGRPTLFSGRIKFAPACRACGLDFTQFNVGDGPAAFLTLILGTLVVGLAVWLQLAFSPPWWVHVLIWPVFALGVVIGSLRLAKGALMAAEYQNAAREGRIDRRAP